MNPISAIINPYSIPVRKSACENNSSTENAFPYSTFDNIHFFSDHVDDQHTNSDSNEPNFSSNNTGQQAVLIPDTPTQVVLTEERQSTNFSTPSTIKEGPTKHRFQPPPETLLVASNFSTTPTKKTEYARQPAIAFGEATKCTEQLSDRALTQEFHEFQSKRKQFQNFLRLESKFNEFLSKESDTPALREQTRTTNITAFRSQVTPTINTLDSNQQLSQTNTSDTRGPLQSAHPMYSVQPMPSLQHNQQSDLTDKAKLARAIELELVFQDYQQAQMLLMELAHKITFEGIVASYRLVIIESKINISFSKFYIRSNDRFITQLMPKLGSFITYLQSHAIQNSANPAIQFDISALSYSPPNLVCTPQMDYFLDVLFGNTTALVDKAEAYCLLGNHFFQRKEYSIAHTLFSYAQKAGNRDASFSLAIMYDKGYAVKRDSTQYIHYLTFAANRSHAGALNIFAAHYFDLSKQKNTIDSDEVNKNSALYLESVQRAAKLNHPVALANLGLHYLNSNDGVTANWVEAKGHLDKSISLGSTLAVINLGKAYQLGLAGVSKDINTAKKYFEKAADLGSAEAMNRLAKMYLDGTLETSTYRDNTPISKEEMAITYLEFASELNHKQSYFELGQLYENKKQYIAALEAFKQASKLGEFRCSLYLVAFCYRQYTKTKNEKVLVSMKFYYDRAVSQRNKMSCDDVLAKFGLPSTRLAELFSQLPSLTRSAAEG